tara:strand:- start:347 stop:550 length:204 start_codon:yes stop_codon:yes gene_type:complete
MEFKKFSRHELDNMKNSIKNDSMNLIGPLNISLLNILSDIDSFCKRQIQVNKEKLESLNSFFDLPIK